MVSAWHEDKARVLAPHTCLYLFSIWVYVNLYRNRAVRDFVAHFRSLDRRCVRPMITYDDTSATLASDQFNPNSVGRLEDTIELPYCIMSSYKLGTQSRRSYRMYLDSVIIVLNARFSAMFGKFSETLRPRLRGGTTCPIPCAAAPPISKRMRGTPYWMGRCLTNIA